LTLQQGIALTLLLAGLVGLFVRMAFFDQPPSGREHGPPDSMASNEPFSSYHGGADHGGDGGHGGH
jgi:hypothetical protein